VTHRGPFQPRTFWDSVNPPHGMPVPILEGVRGQLGAGAVRKMSPLSLLPFCSPSGDTETICQLLKSLWALGLEIHFPERGTAQCCPLLTSASCEMETKDRQGLATGLPHWVQSCSSREPGASQCLRNRALGGEGMAAPLLGGSGEEKRYQQGFKFLNPNKEGWGRRQGH